MNEPHLILGIGELLWDMLPSGNRLGGAPANFTVMAGRLGNHAAILSRIGRDDLGREAVHQLDPLPADTSFLQIDPAHETGRVTVLFNDGQPEYTIHKPAAWDYLDLSDEWVRLAERADAICFGSLAQRNLDSRQTIQTLAAQTSSRCIRIFDVNLRPPFYSSEIIQESLELATVVKMNDAEVPLVLALLGLAVEGEDPRQKLRLGAERLLVEFPTLDMVAITRGGHGSLLVRRDEWHEHPRLPCQSRRHYRGRRCIYRRNDSLPPPRSRTASPQRGREPLGWLDSVAVRGHAAAAANRSQRDRGCHRPVRLISPMARFV